MKQDDIRAFLKKRFRAKGNDADFGNADSIFLSGSLDSLDAMELVVFLEREYGLDFAKIGFDLEELDTVDLVSELVERESKS